MATGQTPIRKRPYPNESDVPDAAADIEALAMALETTPVVTQGALASRPTTAAAGDRYYVTGDPTAINNNIEWYYTGTGWVQITPDEPPIGAGALYFANNDPADTNWLICDGRALSRSAYPVLYSLMGTAYGAGDGSTTFNLPDLRQRFPLGKRPAGAASGTGSNLGETAGFIDHTHTIPGLSVPGLSIPGLSIPVLGVQPHNHGLSNNGGAQLRADAEVQTFAVYSGQSGPNFNTVGYALGHWASTAYGGGQDFGSGASGAMASYALCGSTDSDFAATYAGTTGGGTTGGGVTGGGTTGSHNPPYLTVNFIIRVS